jgi:GNAT superfamily N-acetyltransferase
MAILIRETQLTDLKPWTNLWQSYLSFYQSETLGKHITDLLWQRIHTVEHPIHCLVAQDSQSKELIGLVHFMNHSDTWSKNDVCYLEDLFVCGDHRNSGVGEALINAVHQRAYKKKWARVYWHTKENNKRARSLYDKLTGGPDGFISYRLSTN